MEIQPACWGCIGQNLVQVVPVWCGIHHVDGVGVCEHHIHFGEALFCLAHLHPWHRAQIIALNTTALVVSIRVGKVNVFTFLVTEAPLFTFIAVWKMETLKSRKYRSNFLLSPFPVWLNHWKKWRASICSKQEDLTLTRKINTKSVTHRYMICCHWQPSFPSGRHRSRPPENSCSRGHSPDSRTNCSLKTIIQGSMNYVSRRGNQQSWRY